MAHTLARRNRAVWDRPVPDTRLLPPSFPNTVSLHCPFDHLRMSIIASAPSRPTSPQRYCAADACVPSPQMISHGFYPKRACPMAVDARVPSPRMITHGSHPKRACPTTVDARVLSRMTARSALRGVEADACANPQMISRSAFTGVEADACANPQMISRSAFTGVEADACANPQMISRAPFRAAEGALATLILTLSPFRHSRPLPRGACPPKADHSGLRAGIHPLTSSLSSSRDDRPVALGVGAPKWGAHTSLPIHERTRLLAHTPTPQPQPNMEHPPLAEPPQVDQKPNPLDTSPGFPLPP